MDFLLYKDDDSVLQFKSYSVLKDEAKKILNRQAWKVRVRCTQNEIYLNGWMFPTNREEKQISGGYVVLTFPLLEVDL